MKRKIEGLMVAFFLVTVWAMAWAQDGTAAAAGGMNLGWDFVVLSLLTVGVMEGSKRILPDALEVKWLPIIAHGWSLIGTAVVAAIFHKLPGSWAAVLPLLGQAAAQAIVASGLRTQVWTSAAIVTGADSKTLGDGRK